MNQIHPWLRYIFYIGGFLSLLAGIQLFLLSDRTDILFSWTIQSTLTAATYGGFYFGTMTFAILAVREKVWANVRGPAFGLLVFMVVTMAATLLHIDKFHLGSENILPRASAWLWMSIYILLPFAIVVALILQVRMRGTDPQRTSSLPAWIRILLVLHGIAGIAIAIPLFFIPQGIIPAWPWSLTPLTSRALAAWFASFGVVDLQTVRDNDWARAKIMTFGYIVSSLLAMIAVARYTSQVNWQSMGSSGYLLYLVVMLAIGVTGFLKARRA